MTADEQWQLRYQRDNGTVPPPFRRETLIQIDRGGMGRYVRRCGYDSEGPQWRGSFELDADQRGALLAAVRALPIDIDWSPDARPTVGGPTTLIEFEGAGIVLCTPARLRESQRKVVEALTELIQALVPPGLRESARAWEAEHGEE
ncbi:MAG: hypothetical protein U1F26_07005 [Lysobacterales bacterium]